MAPSYWIKLYHEILDDPKMGRLPDRLWRRVVECFLLAGKAGEEGFLPSLDDMSWILRCDPDELERELQEIAGRTGILDKRPDEEDDERWFVVHFEARQAAVSSTERVRRHRARDKSNDSETKRYNDVTKDETETDQNETDIDTDIDTDKRERRKERETERNVSSSAPAVSEVILYHQQLSGVKLNAAQQQTLMAGVEDLGPGPVKRAVKEWLERGHRPWNIDGILDVARHGWAQGNGAGRRKTELTGEDYRRSAERWGINTA